MERSPTLSEVVGEARKKKKAMDDQRHSGSMWQKNSSSENDCFAGGAVEEAEESDYPLSSVSIGGHPLCNLRFADDADLRRSSEEEPQQLTQKLEETAAE